MIRRIVCRVIGHAWMTTGRQTETHVWPGFHPFRKVYIEWRVERCLCCDRERLTQIPDPFAPVEPSRKDVQRAYWARKAT